MDILSRQFDNQGVTTVSPHYLYKWNIRLEAVASFPLILSHIARYAPSSERKICIQINHKILSSNFDHLLIRTILPNNNLMSIQDINAF